MTKLTTLTRLVPAQQAFTAKANRSLHRALEAALVLMKCSKVQQTAPNAPQVGIELAHCILQYSTKAFSTGLLPLEVFLAEYVFLSLTQIEIM